MRISDWSSDVCSSDLNASIFARISKSDGQRPMSAHRVSEDGLSRHISREIRRDESRKLVRYISKHPVILRERLNGRVHIKASANQIGRTSCRARVCQYV